MSEFAREELKRHGAAQPAALTIGNFDGVHLGHQHLVRALIERAKARGLRAGAITLYPDPVRVLRPDEPMQYLTSLEERVELLLELGLDFVAPLSFTSEFAALSPAEFCGLLHQELGLRFLLLGPDNTFGRNREATPENVRALGAGMGFEVEVLAAPLSTGEAPVSATSIRQALAAGEIEAASRQLGRRYSIRGPVVRGDQRGRTIGFPTANIAVMAERALPANGVYATWAYVGDARYPAATNIGLRPTFEGKSVSVETYLIDFDGDLYDKSLRIEIVARLRPEQKFDGIEALKAQLARDVEQARAVLVADAGS